LSDPTQGELVPSTRAALADLEERLRQLRQDIARLELTAPAAGTVLPAPPQEQPGKEGALAGWRGTPLDERNAGSYLRAGTLLCLVGDPRRTEALLTIDQSDIDLVAVGQRVRLQLDQLSGQTIEGTLVEIALSPVAANDRDTERRGVSSDINARRTDERRVVYTGRMRFDKQPVLVARSGGKAKIAVASLPLGARLSRWLSQSLRF
jgi:multidrug resistance efflux pump